MLPASLRTLSKARAYPFDTLRRAPVINDTFDNEPVVLVYRPESAGGRAYVRESGGNLLIM